MKIITYSDLHLEFKHPFTVPKCDADVLVLSGDITLASQPQHLKFLLKYWQTKPVLYVLGNHEFYTHEPMRVGINNLREYCKVNLPNVTILDNESTTINGVHFFGGTMWTDFNRNSIDSMEHALMCMNDYRLIMTNKLTSLTPQLTTTLHKKFKQELRKWFRRKDLVGKRVVITHHAPVINEDSKYNGGLLNPAFVCTDMLPIILSYNPALWIYGHTHECFDKLVGETRIISNQRGYLMVGHNFECGMGIGRKFDELGMGVIV